MNTSTILSQRNLPTLALLLFALRFLACTAESTPSGAVSGSGGSGGGGGEEDLTCSVSSDCPRRQNVCRSQGASEIALNFEPPTCVQGRCLYENTQEECGGALPRCRSCPSPEDRAVCYAPSATGEPAPACSSGSGGVAGQGGNQNNPSTGTLTLGPCATESDCKTPPDACEATPSHNIAVNHKAPTCVGGICKVQFSREPCDAEGSGACGIACVGGGAPRAYCVSSSTAGGGFLGDNPCYPDAQGGAGNGGAGNGGAGNGGAGQGGVGEAGVGQGGVGQSGAGQGGIGQGGTGTSTGTLTFGVCASTKDCKTPPDACEVTPSLAGIAINYKEPTCVEGTCKVDFSKESCKADVYDACGIACVSGGPPKAYCYFSSTAGGGFLGQNPCYPDAQGGAGNGGAGGS